jgi:hypothetical protein
MDPTTACEPRMPLLICSDAARESALRFPGSVLMII